MGVAKYLLQVVLRSLAVYIHFPHFFPQVTFRNEQTGEYLFYHVNFKSTPPGIMGKIELTTAVRKSTSHSITIPNPLLSPVKMSTSTSVSDISIPPSFMMGGQGEVCYGGGKGKGLRMRVLAGSVGARKFADSL